MVLAQEKTNNPVQQNRVARNSHLYVEVQYRMDLIFQMRREKEGNKGELHNKRCYEISIWKRVKLDSYPTHVQK